MNSLNEETKSVINNEFDYSNAIPKIEYITHLIKYFNGVYKQFLQLIEQDEEKNKQFKDEFRNYEYKKKYSERFEINIKLKTYHNITCKDLETFQSAIQDNNLNNINALEITMHLDYKRGKGNNLEEHDNAFSIIIQPYDIIFARKSNHNESQMNKIEDNINNILKQIPTVNTIFYTK